jgi:LuxR family transcriptional regulator, maltose regulon positive regulatory protein
MLRNKIDLRAATSPTSLPGLSQVLASKLTPPIPKSGQIERPRLIDLVAKARWARLILIQAPAGFGKTTVMLQTRARLVGSGIPCAWLTLDQADNDVGRFLACLTLLCARLDPEAVAPTGHATAQVVVGRSVIDLMDRFARIERPFGLFIDDFESIQNPAVIALVKELLDRLPARAQLVLSTRTVPALELGRLRGCGELLDIQPAQLRFSIQETDEFMRAGRGLSLRVDDVEKLHRRTEGWAVALWLASLALERRAEHSSFIAEFSGSNSVMADYLAQDVLSRLPETLRQFLAKTSILGRFNAALCDAVCGRGDSAAVLEELERANLFVVPLGGDPQWYRYHSLLAEYLQSRLKLTAPQSVPLLHRAASEWYRRQRRPVPAIEHAFASADLEYALELLALHAEQLLADGRVRLLSRWLDVVPQTLLENYPRLRAVHAWSLAFTRGPSEAMARVEAMERAQIDDPDTTAHLLALRPMLLDMMDMSEAAWSVGTDNLKLLPTGRSYPRSILSNATANAAVTLGNHEQALALLEEARRQQGIQVSVFNQVYSECVEGNLDLMQGRLQQALGRFNVAARAGAAETSSYTNGNAMAALLLAISLYEAGDAEQSERLLNVYLPLVKDLCLPDLLIVAHVTLARLAQHRGDGERAYRLLSELEQQAHQANLPRAAATTHLERARMAVLREDFGAAQLSLRRAEEGYDWSRAGSFLQLANDVELPRLARLRLAVRNGGAADALPALSSELTCALAAGRQRRALHLRLWMAEALHVDGRIRQAMGVIGEALRFGAREGFVQNFADEGATVMRMVHEYRVTRGPDHAFGHTAISKDFLGRVLRPFDRDPATRSPLSAHDPVFVEPLTHKELRILELLAEGLSNTKIGKRLLVSQNTVRTHLRNLNVKLDAANRTQAVAVARRLNLIR